MKKKMLVLLAVLCLLPVGTVRAEEEGAPPTQSAEPADQGVSEEEFETELQNTLQELDLYELQQGLDGDDLAQQILGGGSFNDAIIALGKGENKLDILSILSIFGKGFVSALRSNLNLMVQLILLCCVMSLLGAIGPRVLSGEVAEVCGFLSYALAVSVVVRALVQAFTIGSGAILEMTQLMQSMFPVLITLLTAVGGLASAGIFQPAMSLLTGFIVTMVHKFSLPAILVSGVLTVVQNLSDKIRISRMTSLVMKCATWLTGVVFVIFLGVTAIQGLTGATYDGVTMRTAKFAVGKFIPVVGNMVSGTMDTLIGCSMVVKNGVGVMGLVLIACKMASPVMQILAITLTLKLTAALMQPFEEKRLAGCLQDLSQVTTLLYIAVLSVGVMMFISLTLLIRAGTLNMGG